ncbi:MAG: UDP-2,3-diacylglucosamine diphosphatase [Saprospiraceae bacterium]
MNKKKIYFASDFHLGADGKLTSKEREIQIVNWLSSIQGEIEELYLVGDIFDYWFEYKNAIPKGFSLFLGKLAELRALNIPIYLFTGNHDMWMFGYFEEELGIPIYRKPIIKKIQGKDLFIGHGDGLGPKDYGYKLLKKILNNRLCQWAYARIHPNLGIGLMKYFSSLSRGFGNEQFHSKSKERLIEYCESEIQKSKIDIFVFGHRHLPLDVTLSNNKSKYYNLGDWVNFQSYGMMYNGEFTIEYYNKINKTVIVE